MPASTSPLLRELVFTSHTHSGYSHLSHRVYPLQTSAHTSAELTKISSTVGKDEGKGEEGEKEGEGEGISAAVGVGKGHSILAEDEEVNHSSQSPVAEYMCWTDIPLFLFTYIPKVCVVSDG